MDHHRFLHLLLLLIMIIIVQTYHISSQIYLIDIQDVLTRVTSDFQCYMLSHEFKTQVLVKLKEKEPVSRIVFY